MPKGQRVNENVRAFIELVKADSELVERLSKMDAAEVIAVAKEKGIELSEDDFKPAVDELDEGELGNVAGGACACPFLGAGGGHDAEDSNLYVCVCIVYGQGGDGRIDDANCACPFCGSGYNVQQWYDLRQ